MQLHNLAWYIIVAVANQQKNKFKEDLALAYSKPHITEDDGDTELCVSLQARDSSPDEEFGNYGT